MQRLLLLAIVLSLFALSIGTFAQQPTPRRIGVAAIRSVSKVRKQRRSGRGFATPVMSRAATS